MYHEKQTPLEVQVSMLLSLPARMLGFVQPDLGSVASLTGWRRADLRTSAGNLDCCMFSSSRSHLPITHEHRSGGTLSLPPLRTSVQGKSDFSGLEKRLKRINWQCRYNINFLASLLPFCFCRQEEDLIFSVRHKVKERE